MRSRKGVRLRVDVCLHHHSGWAGWERWEGLRKGHWLDLQQFTGHSGREGARLVAALARMQLLAFSPGVAQKS